jgi:vacuolar-type H+-ATPase subunit H
MNEVLSAEREARDAVERRRSEAAQILAAAEEGARRIAQRTEGRVRLINRIADEAVERARREIQGSRSDFALAVPEAEVHELLERALDALVDEIVPGQP